MGKVVVTARRREETLQDVPVSVTAFSAEQLSKQGIPDITALAFSLPNTTLKASRAHQLDPDRVHPRRRPAGSAGRLRGRRRHLPRRHLPGPPTRRRGRHLRRRAHRSAARPAGHAVRPQHHRRRGQVRHPQAGAEHRNRASRPPSATTASATACSPPAPRCPKRARIGGSIAKFNRDGFGTNLTTGRGNYDKDLAAARVSAEFTPRTDLFIRLAADAHPGRFATRVTATA